MLSAAGRRGQAERDPSGTIRSCRSRSPGRTSHERISAIREQDELLVSLLTRCRAMRFNRARRVLRCTLRRDQHRRWPTAAATFIRLRPAGGRFHCPSGVAVRVGPGRRAVGDLTRQPGGGIFEQKERERFGMMEGEGELAPSPQRARRRAPPIPPSAAGSPDPSELTIHARLV